MNITSKCKYRNIHVNDENGLVYLEVHDYLQSQDYELHCFNPLYDIDNIVETLVKNRIEILIRGNNETILHNRREKYALQRNSRAQ